MCHFTEGDQSKNRILAHRIIFLIFFHGFTEPCATHNSEIRLKLVAMQHRKKLNCGESRQIIRRIPIEIHIIIHV